MRGGSLCKNTAAGLLIFAEGHDVIFAEEHEAKMSNPAAFCCNLLQLAETGGHFSAVRCRVPLPLELRWRFRRLFLLGILR